MNIYISENIRRLRRENNLTQEALADFIGISFQAVSKWECGDAYPDITLLPVIANYFQVTIDELLGNDNSKTEEKIQAYLKEYHTLDSVITDDAYKEKVLLVRQAYKEYPYDWRIIDILCHSFIYGKWNDEENYEENKKLIRKLCNMTYDECPDDKFCRNAVTHMIRLSDGEEEEKWLSKINDKKEQREEREWNCLSKGKKEEAFLLYQQNIMDDVRNLTWKLFTYEQNYTDLVSLTDRLEVLKISCNLIDAVYAGDDTELLKILTHEDMARLYFSLGDKENGYMHLETVVDTWTKFWEAPELQDMPLYKSPIFNRLKGNNPHRERGTNIFLDNMNTEKGYDCVRNEARFKHCLTRLKELI